MKPEDLIYKNPEDDIGLGGELPFESSGVAEPDLSPRWLWVFVGDGGLPGYQIWVFFFADEAPRGLPCLEASVPERPALGLHILDPKGRRVRNLSRLLGQTSHRSSKGSSGAARPIPPDMPVYVDAYLVMSTRKCKRSQAYAEIRHAGGKGGRVRLELWKRYRDIQDGLTDQYGEHLCHAPASRPISNPVAASSTHVSTSEKSGRMAEKASGASNAPPASAIPPKDAVRPNPFLPVGSPKRLIPTVTPRKSFR